MWILHLLPDTVILWFCNLLLIAGCMLTALAFFIQAIPLINQYRKPAQVLGIALLVLGVYFRGGLAVETEWRERVAEVEARLKQSQVQSQQLNQRLSTAAQNKTQAIKGRTEYIRQYIDREVQVYDAKFAAGGQCEIPQSFIQAHNTAATPPAKQEQIK